MRGVMDAVSDPAVQAVVVMSSAQVGKALALDTPLPTPTGWTTMGEVRPGDRLFDETGAPCVVTAISPVQHGRGCYRVRFGDGSQLVADGDHRWYVEPSAGDRRRRAAVKTTVELLGDLHTVRRNGRVRNNWAVPVTDGLELPAVDLPVAPYVLGFWLGDGSTYSASLTVGDEDIEAVLALLKGEGVETRARRQRTAWSVLMDPYERDGSYCRGYATRAEYNRARYRHLRYGETFTAVAERRPTMMARLSALGVIGSKFVPAQYLRGSFGQRLALLQGLMDSDGTAARHGLCEFSSTDEGLATAVFELATSLGLKPRLAEGEARLNGKPMGPRYRVTFVAYAETPVFRLARKASRLRSMADPKCRPTETRRRFIVAIDPIDSVPVKCVAVDSLSHLYLAGRAMVPTHNTETLLNIIGFHVAQDPAPILLLQPTLEMGEAFSKDRLAPMVRDTPALQGKIKDPRSRDSGNTLLHKTFPGGHITIAGANSPASLASRPIRVVLADEVDRYPPSAGTEGDPVSLARKRTTTFWNRKAVLTSTPTRKGYSRIEAEWELSDQRRYHVPCPDCGESQHLKWSQVRWPPGRPEAAEYACEHCGSHWSDVRRKRALRVGEWVATAPFSGTAGFHLNEIYSPWVALGDMAKGFLSAKRSPETLKTWVNTSLGESWEEDAEKVDGHALQDRGEDWSAGFPAAVLVVTTGVDVQADRLELEFVGWAPDEESWSLDHQVIYGDPSAPDIWKELDDALQRSFETEDGRTLTVASAAIDSGGHHTQQVYQFAKSRFRRRIYAIKGVAGSGKPVWPKKASRGNKAKVHLFLVGVDAAKDAVYARLRIKEPGPGYCHVPRGRSPTWFEQLTAERVVTRYQRGFPIRVYELPPGRRNEALDCRVYAYAALVGLNVNWGRVQAANGNRRPERPPAKAPPPAASKPPEAFKAVPDPEPPDPPPQTPAPAAPAGVSRSGRRGRRVVRSSFLGR